MESIGHSGRQSGDTYHIDFGSRTSPAQSRDREVSSIKTGKELKKSMAPRE